jgi:myo-inositol-1(or 4)-monophosphatase
LNLNWLNICETLTSSIWEGVKPILGTRDAATFVKRYNRSTKKIDAIAEDTVINYIKDNKLEVTLISEEVGELQFGSAPKYVIVLDPIDGTTNAIKNLPFFSTSIAVAKGKTIGELVFGYVRNYLANEVFYVDQRGAFYNGRKCVSSQSKLLANALVSVYSYSYVNASLIQKILKKLRKMRLFGAISLELTYVGSNKLDALVDLRGHLKITDIAAGILFLKKAGGVYTDAYGNPLTEKLDINAGYSLIAAGNENLHQRILKTLNTQ